MEGFFLETDEVFAAVLDSVRKYFSECALYISSETDAEYDDVKEFYAGAISLIDGFLSKLDLENKNFTELVTSLDEESMMTLYESIAVYAGDFVVSGDEAQREKDMEEYEKVDYILGLFFDPSEEDAS